MKTMATKGKGKAAKPKNGKEQAEVEIDPLEEIPIETHDLAFMRQINADMAAAAQQLQRAEQMALDAQARVQQLAGGLEAYERTRTVYAKGFDDRYPFNGLIYEPDLKKEAFVLVKEAEE